MQYPYSWTTQHGHNVTVKELVRNQFYFTGTYNNDTKSGINFSVDKGSALPLPAPNESELTSEEYEVYIEWSKLDQTI
ncbi:MAG: hypothetical protein IPI88_07280 [Chitinophagaceae bacterium]|nr:hypothetical protein [Chitinophagaceae bacterium]